MAKVFSKASNRLCLAVTAAAIITAAGVIGAEAGERGCTNCYQRVVTPPVLGTVHQTVVVSPAHTVSRIVPADIRTVEQPVVMRPASTIERSAPAEYRTIAHNVMVSPAKKVWQVTRDAHGREVGCWVKVPAQYAVQHSQVLVRPARTWLETAPPKYGMVQRQVVVRPQQLVHETVPAVTRVEARTVVVRPGDDYWAPMGGHHNRHRKYDRPIYKY